MKRKLNIHYLLDSFMNSYIKEQGYSVLVERKLCLPEKLVKNLPDLFTSEKSSQQHTQNQTD